MFAAAWTASPQLPSEGFTPNWSREGFWRQSLRQVVRLTAGGERVRVRFSNAYGNSPVRVAGGSVAVGGSGVRLTFGGGSAEGEMPARGELVSDAVQLAVEAGESVVVTLYFDTATGPATFHAQAFTTSYRGGGCLLDEGGNGFTEASESWYFLSAVETDSGRTDGIVLFGDSITDGFGSTPGADRRWSDALASRTGRAVLNAGIGGNLLLNDSAWYGERGVGRFGRDVLRPAGVDTVVVLLGLNDIGFSETDAQPTYKPAPVVSAGEVVAAYRELIRQAGELTVIGATLLPFGGSDHWGERAAKVSYEVNEWVRCSGEFDGVVDLNRVMADPGDPDRLHPAYDFGDQLHPDDEGYGVMADAVARCL